MTLLWLPLAIASYIFQAANGVIDRIIVHREVFRPLVISFWVAIFSLTSLLLPLLGYLPTPWAETLRFVSPVLEIWVLAIIAGVLLQAGLYALYRALHDEEATRVLSALGAVTPIFTLILAWLLLLEHLSFLDLGAFAVLIAGAVALTQNPRGARRRAVMATVAASALFAVQSVMVKIIFELHHFVSVFTIMALGGALYALAILIASPHVRQEVAQTIYRSRPGRKLHVQRQQIWWIIVNSMIGGLSLIAIYLALKLGPPSLVTALRGVQYATVFLIALLLAKRHPRLLDEELSGARVKQKVTGISLIAVGIAMIALDT